MTPLVRHYKDSDNSNDFVMVPGLAITIEPIVLLYPYDEIYMLDDNWTIYCPNNPSAQWEHTLLITDNGFEILTKRDNEELLLKI
jgi:methionyl aminopeptidase